MTEFAAGPRIEREPALEVTDADSLERALAQRHRTPEQVEQFGVEAVPSERKTTGAWDLFGIQLSFQINNLTITMPALAVLAGLNVWAALLSQVIGVGLVFLGYIALATIGSKYGIPGQVGARIAFGVFGSKVTASLMRSIASAYWFAWQTLAAALGIQVILKAWTGNDYDLIVISVLFAVFQTAIALTGWESLRYLTRVVLPIKLVFLSVVIIAFVTSSRPEFGWTHVTSGGSWAWSGIALWAGTIAAGHLSMYTDSADLARYAKSSRSMAAAFYGAALVSVVFCGIIGIWAAKGVGDGNWFAGAADVQPHVWMYLLLIIVLVADNWFINIMNLYTGGFAVVNVIGRIGRFWSTVLIAIAGITLSGFKGVYDNTPTFVNEIGFAFAPVGGILLAHYVLLSRGRIDLPSIYTPLRGAYRYLGGVNPVAVVVGVLGYLLARSDLIGTALIRPLAVVVITGAAYAVAMAVVARVWAPARDSIAHEAMKDHYDPVEIDRDLVAA